MLCEHAECRREQENELAWIGMRLRRADVLALVPLAPGRVRCREVPRRGAVDAPFPGEERNAKS